jgi:hypothetical protein
MSDTPSRTQASLPANGGSAGTGPCARRLAIALAAAVLSGACGRPLAGAAAGAPRPLSAADLAGTWRGDYEGRTYARRGALVVHLDARADTLTGYVELGGLPRNRKSDGFPLTAAERRDARTVRVPIRGARLTGSAVTITSDGYEDAGCDCGVTLVFTGRLTGDTLAGRFTGEVAPTVAPERRGRWRTVREPRGVPPAAAAR